MSGPETPPDTNTASTPKGSNSVAYQVLARKYRPKTFSELIGQGVLVRTLTNAFKLNRLAHGFILTGVRGTGKTTTARIIARSLNCVGPDGHGGPTADPCGVCENCSAITADRHVDVLEMDAASRTGVDDIRELIEGVRYRPTSARFKVYIIDEVHMLSSNAFNALLKTLEEPPEHVKFIFATTEIRKVPVTVLSRCQRYDLSRVDTESLSAHFARITENEGGKITATALHLIARAADGSVRDGLSLLDQAISQADGEISEGEVRAMLGLADRTQTFDLLETIFGGEVADALEQFDRQYRDGSDPMAILEDMLEIVHWLTRIKVVPEAVHDSDVPEMERNRGMDMEARLKMPVLARAWQMLLKGLQEVRFAPSARQAAEMLLIRLAYTAMLPTPDDALKTLGQAQGTKSPTPTPTGVQRTGTEDAAPSALEPLPNTLPETMPQTVSDDTVPQASCDSYDDIVALAGQEREMVLKAHLENDVHVVEFEPGRLEFRPTETAPSDLAGRLTSFLNHQTERRWVVTVSKEAGGATISERRAAAQRDLENEAVEHPLVKSVLESFPGAKLATVTPIYEGDGTED